METSLKVIDFQHHFIPRELFKEDPGDRRTLQYDENGAPRFISHRMLFDLDEHIRMMDFAGIDAAVLTSGPGMCADIERSRLINDKAWEAERHYPGRFIGAAHVHPLGGAESIRELERCSDEFGFQGVVITSEVDGVFLDAPEFEPFWTAASRLGMYVFVHPALRLNDSRQFNAYDSARAVGREFSLIMAIIRLINSGVLDRHPNLTIQMAHLSGGIA
jgi:predicted TIM-barrel fold metal-dependent hydrolase